MPLDPKPLVVGQGAWRPSRQHAPEWYHLASMMLAGGRPGACRSLASTTGVASVAYKTYLNQHPPQRVNDRLVRTRNGRQQLTVPLSGGKVDRTVTYTLVW